jgi:hypothetical protein
VPGLQRNAAETSRSPPETITRQSLFQRPGQVINRRDIFCLSERCSKSAWFAPLVLTVAKLAYRRVIRKAVIFGWRPFRVLSPVVATTSSITARLEVSVAPRRATFPSPLRDAARRQFHPKLSVVSLSLAVRVIGCCEHSTDPFQHGWERLGDFDNMVRGE